MPLDFDSFNKKAESETVKRAGTNLKKFMKLHLLPPVGLMANDILCCMQRTIGDTLGPCHTSSVRYFMDSP